MIKLAIFDLDGTLYEAHRTASAAANAALEELGLPPVSVEFIQEIIGEMMDGFCRLIAPSLSQEERRLLADSVRRRERELIPTHGRLFEGVRSMLQQFIDMGYVLAICSNGSREYVDTVVKCFGIEMFFTHYSCREPGRTKSQAVGDLLVGVKPEYAVMIGDSKFDFIAAKDNALPCIAAAYGYGAADLTQADFVAQCAREITGLAARCEIFAAIELACGCRAAGKPLIIGVNGVDTSGKTQFSNALEQFLRHRGHHTQVIHLDDFHNPRAIRTSGEDENQSYIDHAFNLQRLETELLDPISTCGAVDVELDLLDLDSDTVTNRKRYAVTSNTIVIVEGMLLFRPPIDQYFDLRVFLHIGFDEVLRRAEVRDVPLYGPEFLDRYRRKYIPIQQQYLAKWQPMERGDFVIDNTDYGHPKLIGQPSALG